jgi:hypothetical protein
MAIGHVDFLRVFPVGQNFVPRAQANGKDTSTWAREELLKLAAADKG